MSTILAPSCVLLPGFDKPFSDEEEAAFFASLHQSNGTTRMTSRRRLDDVNAAIATHLPTVSTLEVLDAGISSGISSLEWLLSLDLLGHRRTMTAFDRVLSARLFRIGRLQMLAEREGHVLLIHTGWNALTRPVRKTASWRNRIVRAAFRIGDTTAYLGGVARAGREVLLVSWRLSSRSDVRLMERDIFNPAPDWIGRFHVVRVANLLNRSYFPEATLRLGLENACSWVRPGGLIAVARTESDGRNDATVFRRDAKGFTVAVRVGAGSEVETLVSSFAP